MGILLAHELGHYIYCERNRVYATLPYFIPGPVISPIGTFGAVIRIKSPIRSRQALFDIGIAGPIGGFIVAVPVLLCGLALSKPMPPQASGSLLDFGYPLIFRLSHDLIGLAVPHLPPLDSLYLHPIGVAAWVGMFATALNLLPGGQFDGGHIIYAVSPKAHKIVTRISVVVLAFLGIYWPAWGTWSWPGWLIWAVILGLTGWRHPNVPKWPDLDSKRRRLTLVALLMLLLTFVLAPVHGAALTGN
jgi:membrane-associated protease RseP (regulator of RpoE activity)